MSEEEEKTEKKNRLSSLYVYDYSKGSINLKNKKCSRCGNIMAHHEMPVERWTCGACNFTEIIERQATG